MATFKLSKDAKEAFKQKLENKIVVNNEESPTFELKEIIKTDVEMKFKVEPCDLNLVKQEEIQIIEVEDEEKDEENDKDEDKNEDKNEDKDENENQDHFEDRDSKNGISISNTKTKIESPTDSEKSDSGLLRIKRSCPLKNKVRRPTSKPRREPLIVTATRVYAYISSKDPSSLTRKQIESLKWAELVMMGRIVPRISIEIPDDENDIFPNETFSTNETITIPDTYQLAIVDFASPGGRYTLEMARLIENTLSKAVVKYILENPNVKPPIFGKSVYFDGVLVLDCKDQTAYDFAKLILWDIKLWNGSKLKIIEPQRTPFDTIGSLNAPDMGMNKNKVLEVLKAQNPSVNMADWKILEETSLKFGFKQYAIKISNPPVYFQKHKQLRLHFGGSEVTLKLFGCEWLWK